MLAGKTVGRYEILNLIGQGGMGQVFLGKNTESGEQVAIKVLPDELAKDTTNLQRFLQEAEALRVLNHPNIVKMLDLVEDENQHMLILEYVDGGSLWDMLNEQPQLPVATVLKLGLEVADALSRAHHLKIIHRDIKPANILLTKQGTPRLTDFGLARMTEQQSTMTQSGMIVGSYSYLSPETLENATPDIRMDIWAFGVVMYEMLAGRRPFVAENPAGVLRGILVEAVPDLTTFRQDLPPNLVALVHWMLEKDPEKRIASARRVGAELEAIIDNLDSGVVQNLTHDIERIRETRRFDLATPSPISRETHLSPTPHDIPTTIVSPQPTAEAITEAEAPTLLVKPKLTPQVQGGRDWRVWGGIAVVVLLVVIGAAAFLLSGGGDDVEAQPAAEVVPIEVEPVAPDEIMVLVADLEPLDAPRENVTRFIRDDLRQVIELGAPATKARIREYAGIIRSTDEARDIAAEYGAQVVLWGNYSDDLIEVEILLGEVEGGQLSAEVMQSASTVRLRLTNERQQSIAPHIFANLAMWHIFRGDISGSMIAMLSIEDLASVEPAEIIGATVGADMSHYFQDIFVDSESAIEWLDSALVLEPTNPVMYHYRAVARMRLSLIQEARQDTDSAIRLSSNEWAAPLIVQANLLFNDGDVENAIARMDEVVEIQPEDSFTYMVRGGFHYLNGDYDAAQFDINKSTEYGAEINFPYVISIILAIRDGRLEESLDTMDLILREFPDPTFGNRVVANFAGTELLFSSFFSELFSAFSNLVLGQVDAALQNSQAALEIRDDLPEVYMLQGITYCLLGDNESAEAAYTGGLELDPDFTVLYLLRADVRSRQNNFAGSLQDLSAAEETTHWEQFAPFVEEAMSGGDTLGCESFFP